MIPLVIIGIFAPLVFSSDSNLRIVAVTQGEGQQHVVLAAKELRRYWHQIYREFEEIEVVSLSESISESDLERLVLKDVTKELILISVASPAIATLAGIRDELSNDDHVLRTVGIKGVKVHMVAGASPLGSLYATYRLLSHIGVRFYLKGDLVPSSPRVDGIPNLDEDATPTFALRGLQPFHDFFEGPDWWSADMHKAVLTQITKQRMNFIGFHTYPYSSTQETGTNEPTVWVGLPEYVNPDGTVSLSYPTAYANTLRDQWGENAVNTSDFAFGASQLFESDCYGSTVQVGNCPFPTTPEGSNAVFNAAGNLFNDAFTFAHEMGVKTCVGTETPLSMSPTGVPVVEPLNLYRSPSRQDSFVTTTECDECESLYQFVEIEGFVWSNEFPGSVALSTYYNGHDNFLTTGAPPPGYGFVRVEGYAWPNTTSNDTLVPLSLYYNPEIGDHFSTGTAAGRAYADANGYDLLEAVQAYVIPNATLLTQRFYEGIFTRIERTYPIDYYWIWTPEGWEWGAMTSNTSDFDDAVNDLAAALAAHDAVNASFDMATCGWVLGPLPDRTIFDKVLSTRYAAISSIDMDVGNMPVDPAYANVTRHSKWAIPWMEDDPGLTAPELRVNRTLEHMLEAASYNCSGLLGIHWRTGVTSPQIAAMAAHSWNASLVSQDFWVDWALSNFGPANPENSIAIADIFSAIESFNLPRPVNWVTGPGTMTAGQCGNIDQYGFVDQLVALRGGVTGVTELAEFDYWLNNFEYMRAIVNMECAWEIYDNAIAIVQAAPKSQQQQLAEKLALPARIELVANATIMMNFLLQTVSSPGEMGTVTNVIEQSLVVAINDNTQQLQAYLGAPLPANANPPTFYQGPSRLVVPTVRTILDPSESLNLTVIVVVNGSNVGDQSQVSLFYRALSSSGGFQQLAFTLVASSRAVFTVSLPPQGEDFEYYIEAALVTSETIGWPAGAPDIFQSVVIFSP